MIWTMTMTPFAPLSGCIMTTRISVLSAWPMKQRAGSYGPDMNWSVGTPTIVDVSGNGAESKMVFTVHVAVRSLRSWKTCSAMSAMSLVITANLNNLSIRNASILGPFLILTFKAWNMSLSSLSSCFDIVRTEGTLLDFQEAPVTYFVPAASGIAPVGPIELSGSLVAYLAGATGFIHTRQE